MTSRPGKAQAKLDLKGLTVLQQKIEDLERRIDALSQDPNTSRENLAGLMKALSILRASKAEIPEVKVLIEDRLDEP